MSEGREVKSRKIDRKIGNGTYAFVYLLDTGDILKQNKTCYPASIFCLIEYECLKMLNRYDMFTRLVDAEILPILRSSEDLSDHEGAPMYRDRLNLIMEKCDMDLAIYLVQEGTSDIYNKSIITQLLCAISCMHSLRIVHRDLSTSNILIKFVNGKPLVKVADFGISSIGYKESPLTSATSSIFFRAPEVYQFVDPLCYHSKKYYNYKSDLWSLGCIIYTIVNKDHFFTNRVDEGKSSYDKLKRRLVKLEIENPDKPESKIYNKLLKFDPDERVDADLILGDDYFDSEREYIKSHSPTEYKDSSDQYYVYPFPRFAIPVVYEGIDIMVTEKDLVTYIVDLDVEMEIKAIAVDIYARYLRLFQPSKTSEIKAVNKLDLILICLIYGYIYRLPSQSPPIDDFITSMNNVSLPCSFDPNLNVEVFKKLVDEDKRIYRPTLYETMTRHGYHINDYSYLMLISSVRKEKVKYLNFIE